MHELWDTNAPPRLLARVPGFDAAAAALDAECRRRHAQALANGEGATGIRYRFEIRDEQGPVMWLVYCPDLDLPYCSVLNETAAGLAYEVTDEPPGEVAS